MGDKGDRRKTPLEEMRSAHHQDHGARYAFIILDYPLFMYRSRSICLICIANHIRSYNWYKFSRSTHSQHDNEVQDHIGVWLNVYFLVSFCQVSKRDFKGVGFLILEDI